MALAQTAERLGAVSRSGEVVGVNTTGDRVRSVMLRDAEIECEHVVFATGPWSGQVEDWLGVRVPVEPLKGEILRMRPPGVLPPGPDVQGAGVSLYSRDDQVWIGSTEERKGFDTKPSTSARDRLMAGAQRLMPAMADAELVLHTACLRPVTPDWLPIIGRAPGWDNVYLATGAGRKGNPHQSRHGQGAGRPDLNGYHGPASGRLCAGPLRGLTAHVSRSIHVS